MGLNEELSKSMENLVGFLELEKREVFDIGDTVTIGNTAGALFDLKKPDELKISKKGTEVIKRVSISRKQAEYFIEDPTKFNELLSTIRNYMIINQGCFSITFKRPDGDLYCKMLETTGAFEIRCVGYILED